MDLPRIFEAFVGHEMTDEDAAALIFHDGENGDVKLIEYGTLDEISVILGVAVGRHCLTAADKSKFNLQEATAMVMKDVFEVAKSIVKKKVDES